MAMAEPMDAYAHPLHTSSVYNEELGHNQLTLQMYMIFISLVGKVCNV